MSAHFWRKAQIGGAGRADDQVDAARPGFAGIVLAQLCPQLLKIFKHLVSPQHDDMVGR